MIRIFLLSTVLTFSIISNAQDLSITPKPNSNPVPGGVAIVPIPYSGESPPEVKFGNENVIVFKSDNKWFSAVGLEMDIVPGKYILTINRHQQNEHKTVFRVFPLPASKSQRTIKLSKELSNLDFFLFESPDDYSLEISSYSEYDAPKTSFNFDQIIGSGSYIPYGRIINNPSDSDLIKHPWITYITNQDEIVRAPSKSLVERIFLSKNSGITVILNHGKYLRSVINNLEDIILKPGQIINAGDAIGTPSQILNSELYRVDWSVLLNNTYIDPLQFSPSS